MKCPKCGADKGLFSCPKCGTWNAGLGCTLIFLAVIGAGYYVFWALQQPYPHRTERIQSNLVTEHKDQIHQFFKEMKANKETLESFEYTGQDFWEQGPLSCLDIFEGHTDMCWDFYVPDLGKTDQGILLCSEAIDFAKGLGASDEFTKNRNIATPLGSSSVNNCAENYKRGYLLTGTATNDVPFSVYMYQNEAEYITLVVSPRYENLDIRLLE